MHGHDRARLRRDPRRDVLRVEVVRRRIDVREDRNGAPAHDRLGRGVERERGTDDLVAGPDPERVEHDDDRVRAVRYADRVRDAEVLRRLALERLDVRPEDELARIEHVRIGALEPWNQRRVLRLDVYEWDPGHANGV